MKTHQLIDKRSLAMAKAIVSKIDADSSRSGLKNAVDTCRRWEEKSPNIYNREWLKILVKSWEEVRSVLLDESEEGQRLRQNSPFCRTLSPKERWDIYRQFIKYEKTGS